MRRMYSSVVNFNALLITQFVRLITFYLCLPTIGPYWLRFGAQTSQSALGKKSHASLRCFLRWSSLIVGRKQWRQWSQWSAGLLRSDPEECAGERSSEGCIVCINCRQKHKTAKRTTGLPKRTRNLVIMQADRIRLKQWRLKINYALLSTYGSTGAIRVGTKAVVIFLAANTLQLRFPPSHPMKLTPYKR